MKAKTLFLIVAGFLTVFGCANPIIERLYNTAENPPEPIITPEVSYTVAFESDGGSPVNSQTVTKNKTVNRPENPIKEKYGFVNWYDNEDRSDPYYDFDAPVTANIILYAKWNRTVHTVIFNSGGGSPVENQIVGAGGTATRPDNPAKDGHGFVNWYGNEALNDPPYDFDAPVAANITLYAKWSLTFYAVIFETNGGSAVKTQTVGKNGTASRPIPSKEGHTFDNWYSNSGLTTVYDFDTPVASDITLYARWTLNTYAVTFMDGSTVLAALTRNNVAHGSSVSKPGDPAKDGYTFDNWYANSELTAPFSFDVPITANTDVYAKFNINTYTVVFMDGSTALSALTQTVAHGSTANKPTNQTKNDHTFDNWYSDSTLTALYEFDTPITGDITLYARWTLNTYTVTFMDGSTVLTGLTRNNVAHGSSVSKPDDPAKDGYAFDAWYANSGLTALFSFDTPITANTAVYAKFSINTYTVTFTDGSTVLSALTQTVTHGGSVIRPDDPAKDGYIFDNWYSNSNLSAVYNFTAPVTADIALYAKWAFELPIQNLNLVVPYLETQAGTAANPANLPMQIDLGTMTNTGSGWRQLLAALETAGKYVDLDLSRCAMNGIEFNPDRTVSTGKNRIVSIVLPNAATSTADGSSDTTSAFYRFTALKSFSGTGLTSIGKYSFHSRTSLTQTSLPAGITSIGNRAFYNCESLALTELPAGLKTIGDYAFCGCTNLVLTSLPEGITSISQGTFYKCTSLAEISMPSGITSIGDSGFQGCVSLALKELPTEITSIGARAFSGCTSLTEISMPSGITSIGDSAFGKDSTNLVLVICHATTPPTLKKDIILGALAFANTVQQIKVPAGSVAAYKAATNWSTYADKISAIE
ncbi:MAG: InlB B-repeat-containing protein [Treponema sp.]|jgi:uncharacterized repeat protein (TIGR02543 family)|nr:InlB B-repeat-containing protein [Treponema sp.]